VYFSDGNYETKSSKLADENAKRWVVFERRKSYLSFRLAERFSELTTNLERLNCSHWLYSEYRREYQSKLLTGYSSGECCNC